MEKDEMFEGTRAKRVTVAIPTTDMRTLGFGAACLLLCMLSMPLQAQEVAARVQFLVGDVTATSPDGHLRLLRKGDRIYTGETIRTGDEASAQLIYRDRSRMAVRVNTEFTIREYRYQEGNQSASRSIFSLLSGALRTVTGLIGQTNPNNVTIETPNATIGIRGTDHEVVHVVQQAKMLAQAGTYNKVYVGATVMRTAQGNLNLGLRQVGFVGGTPGKVLKPVRIVDLPKAITDQIINKIPMQARIQPQQPDKGKAPATRQPVKPSTSPTRKIDSATTTRSLDSTIKLDSTTTLQKTYDATRTLDPSLSSETFDSTTIKSLDPALNTTIQTDSLKSTIISPTTTESLKSTITSPTTTEKLLAPTTTETLKSTITAPTTTIKK